MVFLLIGFEVPITSLLTSWLPILVAYVAVMASRAVVMLLASLVLRGERCIPVAWAAALTWGGLRGGISMVLALSLSVVDVPHHDVIVTITFGVVVLTILFNRLTMAPLPRVPGIGNPEAQRVQYEVARGGLHAAAAALTELTEMGRKNYHRGVISQEALEAVLRNADARMGELEG